MKSLPPQVILLYLKWGEKRNRQEQARFLPVVVMRFYLGFFFLRRISAIFFSHWRLRASSDVGFLGCLDLGIGKPSFRWGRTDKGDLPTGRQTPQLEKGLAEARIFG